MFPENQTGVQAWNADPLFLKKHVKFEWMIRGALFKVCSICDDWENFCLKEVLTMNFLPIML